MADDDKKQDHAFTISGGVCRGTGPVNDTEVSENMNNFSGALYDVSRQLAAELFDREDVDYHAITIVVACRKHQPIAQNIAFSQGIPASAVATILAQSAGRLMTDATPDEWGEASELPPHGSSRLQ